jgi:5-phospho-D-xylono-1,4-lactonase
MKNKISCVTGEISTKELGYCQCHEHLFIREGQSAKIDPSLCIDNYDLTVSELKMYKEYGGNSIVDAQPLGCGRMTENLLKASHESKVNIIASTGFHRLIFYPETHWIHTIDKDDFINLLINEIKNGMYINADIMYPQKQISARAGIIKTAYEEGPQTARLTELLQAAGTASLSTGIPIMCHTDQGKAALEVIEVLLNLGVPESSIIICHLDRRTDNPEYHLEVIKTGVFLEYDTIGRFKYHSDEAEIRLLRNIINNGYEDNLLLSLDTTRERMLNYGGNIGLNYILSKFMPLMKKAGFNENLIKKLTIENPARALQKKI